MQKKSLLIVTIVILLVSMPVFLIACSNSGSNTPTPAVETSVPTSAVTTKSNASDIMVQYSTLDSLSRGLFEGSRSLQDLQQYGDLGLGTFDDLEGEMIIYEGKFYQALVDGTVKEAPLTATTPFLVITHFETDRTVKLDQGMDFAKFQAAIDKELPSKNLFYAFEVKGKFKSVRVRSVSAKEKGYTTLAEAVKNQAVFEYKDIEGVLVGFRSPTYVDGLNAVGYHMHFISSDRQKGGHVLDFSVQEAEAHIDDTSDFMMLTPDDPAFHETNFQEQPTPGDVKTE